jgi:hypothetical protein
MSKYILDVGVYTRRIKARILYNHLLIAETPQPHIAALVEGDTLVKIVDHRNYSPRIIEWMTDISHVGSLTPAAYPTAFIDALNHRNDFGTSLFACIFRNPVSICFLRYFLAHSTESRLIS